MFHQPRKINKMVHNIFEPYKKSTLDTHTFIQRLQNDFTENNQETNEKLKSQKHLRTEVTKPSLRQTKSQKIIIKDFGKLINHPLNSNQLVKLIPKIKNNYRNIAVKSKPGCYSNLKEKINQDSYLIYDGETKESRFNAFLVFDGHGKHGEKISNSIKDIYQS